MPPLEKQKHRCAGRIMITQLSKKREKNNNNEKENNKKTSETRTQQLKHFNYGKKGSSRDTNGNTFFFPLSGAAKSLKCSRVVFFDKLRDLTYIFRKINTLFRV